MLGVIETAGPQLGVDFWPVDTRTIAEIEHSIAAVARGGYGGLIITSGSGAAVSHRDRIIALAVTLKLPAVYSDRGMSRALLKLAKRSLLWVTLRGFDLLFKNAIARFV